MRYFAYNEYDENGDQIVTMSEEDIVTSIKNCLKENVNNVLANSIIANSANGQKNKRSMNQLF